MDSVCLMEYIIYVEYPILIEWHLFVFILRRSKQSESVQSTGNSLLNFELSGQRSNTCTILRGNNRTQVTQQR